MRQLTNMFENPFSDQKITAARLANFAEDSLSRFKAGNTADRYTMLVEQMSLSLKALKTDLGWVASSTGERMGKTLTVKQFLKEFKKFMGDKKGVIADLVGGFNSPDYINFYPNGMRGYSHMLRAEVPVVLNRLSLTAAKYSHLLPDELVTHLQQFEITWKEISTAQHRSAASLSSGRTEQRSARLTLEIVLLQAVHIVASQFPGQVMQCQCFFDFHLLYATKRHREKAMQISDGLKQPNLNTGKNKPA